jgi:hypothetical protein
MPPLSVMLLSKAEGVAPPAEVSVDVTFTNRSDEPARLNLSQAAHPSLVLEVLDEKGERVLLPPPTAPDEADLLPGQPIEPGESVTLTYAGFLDTRLEKGTYRVRYSSPYPALGGSRDDPLVSDWISVSVDPPPPIPKDGRETPDGPEEPGGPGAPRPTSAWEELSKRIKKCIDCFIQLILAWARRCGGTSTQEVDEARTETISDAPAEAEAWNGTYAWRARFRVEVQKAPCRVTVVIRLRSSGTITSAQQAAWESALEAAWSNVFKLCYDATCCPDGSPIVIDVRFVSSQEHHVVNVGTSTTNMSNWGANDTVDISHELGHMLGALDEYFTVNGVAFGPGRQAGGAIMNNPANPPAARNYDLVRQTVEALLGQTLTAIPVASPC